MLCYGGTTLVAVQLQSNKNHKKCSYLFVILLQELTSTFSKRVTLWIQFTPVNGSQRFPLLNLEHSLVQVFVLVQLLNNEEKINCLHMKAYNYFKYTCFTTNCLQEQKNATYYQSLVGSQHQQTVGEDQPTTQPSASLLLMGHHYQYQDLHLLL